MLKYIFLHYILSIDNRIWDRCIGGVYLLLQCKTKAESLSAASSVFTSVCSSPVSAARSY